MTTALLLAAIGKVLPVEVETGCCDDPECCEKGCTGCKK